MNLTMIRQNYTQELFNAENASLVAKCYENLDVRGLIKNICSQYNTHMVKMGIIIVVSYIFLCWFNWWFYNHGYKKMENIKYPVLGRIYEVNRRIYLDVLTRNMHHKWAIAYIVVHLFFTLF